jgi:hypothetical protein
MSHRGSSFDQGLDLVAIIFFEGESRNRIELGLRHTCRFFFLFGPTPCLLTHLFPLSFSGRRTYDLDKISGALYVTWSFLFLFELFFRNKLTHHKASHMNLRLYTHVNSLPLSIDLVYSQHRFGVIKFRSEVSNLI